MKHSNNNHQIAEVLSMSNKIKKKTVVKCKSSAYRTELNKFLVQATLSSAEKPIEKKFHVENTFTKEELLNYNEDDFKLKISNESPLLHGLITALREKDTSCHINKSLIVYDYEKHKIESETIEKLILSSDFANKEIFINNIEAQTNLLSKEKSIELFKNRFKSFTRNEPTNTSVDYLTPLFNSGGSTHTVQQPYLTVKDLSLTPVIQFPKLFEYIKLHENRELIQFLFKYLLMSDNLKSNPDNLVLNNDVHFTTVFVLIYSMSNNDSKIDYLLLKQCYETISDIKNKTERNVKFINKVDPVNKFPQILKINEYELKSLFSKMNTDFKKDYEEVEQNIQNIQNVKLKTFYEHFMKISLLIQFIVSQIVNVTVQISCNSYPNSSTNDVIEIPSLDEFDTIKILLPKILCLDDKYLFSNGKELTMSYNMNSSNKASINQLKNFGNAPDITGESIEAVDKSKNSSNNKKQSKNNTIGHPPTVSEDYLDFSFFINWISPLLNRFFRIPVYLPRFYTVEKLSFENFSGVFKNAVFFTLLSLNSFKKLCLDMPDFLTNYKIDDCYFVGSDPNLEVLDNVTITSFIDEENKKHENDVSSEALQKWRLHLISQYENVLKRNEIVNTTLDEKINHLDVIKFNKIPNLINGKFDDMLSSSSLSTDMLISDEVTSTDNKEMNTKSKYYKFFQDENSISDDLNVNNLKLKLEKAKEQVSILEVRLQELKEGKPEKAANGTAGENSATASALQAKRVTLDSELLGLQEAYKDTSNIAYNKATHLNQLNQLLTHREKYLKILDSQSLVHEKVKSDDEWNAKNYQSENYKSLLQVLKVKQEKLLEQEK